jgi:Methyltransferase domain
MQLADRVALEGVLADLQPSLAIEIGVYRAGSLERISRHSERVHAFDLEARPVLTADRFPNVTFHFGSSHDLLAPLLGELAGAGENVDFALVDGDHTSAGVQQDVEDLLRSPALARSVIVIHDTLNPGVRAGLERVDYASYAKITLLDLDFVQGVAMREGPRRGELWNGLGLIVVGWEVAVSEVHEPTHRAPDVYTAFSRALERSWRRRLSAPLRRARRGWGTRRG